MANSPYYENGSWKVVCDVCGGEYKSDQLTKRWDGLMTCSKDWEPRQPQDFVRGVADKIVPPSVRPEQEDQYIFVCTPLTSQGIADYGAADCARAGINFGIRPECTVLGSTAVVGLAVVGCSRVGRDQPGT
jgi:hypothetical protein